MSLALGAVLVAPAAARAAIPPQGLYDSCPPGETPQSVEVCIRHLQEQRAAGFRVVLNNDGLSGTPDRVRHYADEAERLGMRVIWPLHHPRLTDGTTDLRTTFPAMTTACGCRHPARLVPFMVGVVRSLPATWGYYVADEPEPEEQAAEARHGGRIRAADPDPGHARLLVQQGEPWQRLSPFAAAADTLATDNYPVGMTDRLEDVADAARATQAVSDHHAKGGIAMVLQSFSWGPRYAAVPERWPTVTELKRMRDLAVQNARLELVLWWAAHRIRESREAAGHWSRLAAAAFCPESWENPQRTVTGSDWTAMPLVQAVPAGEACQ